MGARSADRCALLARGEPPLDSHGLAIGREREVDREVRQILVEGATRSLDDKFPRLDGNGDTVRHRHGLRLEDGFLKGRGRQVASQAQSTIEQGEIDT